MTISFKWLKDYIHTDLTAEEVAAILTGIGLEIEGLTVHEQIPESLAGVVVAEVLTCENHPDSDHLHITTVFDGTQTVQVVCGAANVAAGQKVILATVGANLYPVSGEGPIKIKKSKIRGVESLGMICAEDEIGTGTSHAGIIVLPEDAVPGTPAAEYFHLENETVMEIGLTPNRVDGASVYGVARDLAAYLTAGGNPQKAQLPSVPEVKDECGELPISVSVETASGAPRYMGVTMTGLKIAPSPEWMQQRLRAVGINPKNNLVDITNFILFECGQPLHAFDAAKIGGGKLVVRYAKEGEPFKTLDGVDRKLSAEDLVICDEQKPMCLAGVFGGIDSGVSETTTSVFIESAYFNPVSVRKTAKRHGLSTDASFRFERGADPDMAPYALARCVQLMKELAGGKVSSAVTDFYPEKIEPFSVDISLSRINALIGKSLPKDKVLSILNGLEMKVLADNGDNLLISVPRYRVDVQRECDVAEDILRIYGYNNVENPSGIKLSVNYDNPKSNERMVSVVSDLLTSLGANEIMSNSLSQSAYYADSKTFPESSLVRIMNPLSSDLDAMRQTLLFNALEAVALNVNRKQSILRLYEFGNCYQYTGQGEGVKNYKEGMRLSIAVSGDSGTPSWRAADSKVNFFTLKELVEKALLRVGVNLYEGEWKPTSNDLFSEGVDYIVRGGQLLSMGVVSAAVRQKLDIKQPVYFAEIDVDRLFKIQQTVRVKAQELSKFQPVRRDLALLVDSSVTFTSLRQAATKAEKKLLSSVMLFDVYEGDKLPSGKKSYALGFILEDATRTLTDKDIEKTMDNIARSLKENCSAEIRG